MEVRSIVKASEMPPDKLEANRKLFRTLEDKWQRTRLARNPLELDMPQINQYIRPNTPRVYSLPSNSIVGRAKTDRIYDTTGLEANIDFASQMQSYVTSPIERWFRIGRLDKDDEELTPLESESRSKIEAIMMKFFARPSASFASATHEYFLDLGAYGNSLLYGEYSDEYKCPVYRSHPFVNIYFVENCYGLIDTVMMAYRYEARQLKDLHRKIPGGLIALPDSVVIAKDDEIFNVVKVVMPREAYKDVANAPLADRTQKPYAMVLWMPEHNLVIYEGGHDNDSYFPGRLMKISGDTYGTGSGQLALPAILNLQTVRRDYMISGALNLRHPWWVEDDSIVSPFDGNLIPGLILKGQPGSKKPEPLAPAGQLEYGDNFIVNLQQQIRKLFWLDDLIRERKRERQSYGEIADERSEMLKGLSPIFARGADECFSKLLKWHFLTLVDKKHIGSDLVQSSGITEENFFVTFVGPLAKMYKSMRTSNIQGFLQDLAQLLPAAPGAADELDMPKLVRIQAGNRDVEDVAFVTEEEKNRRQQRREENEDAAVQAQVGEGASQIIKNVADAQQKGLGVY